jgi:Right handed beta helix region
MRLFQRIGCIRIAVFPALVVLLLAHGLPAGAQNCSGVQLTPSSNVQNALDSNATGTTFCFANGTYRITTPWNPKNYQILKAVNQGGAILKGSVVITGFTQSGSNWVATGQLPSKSTPDSNCITKGCQIQQDLYFDGTRLTRVFSTGALAAGKFYEQFGAGGGKIYLRDNPTGHTVEQAYASNVISSTSSGVTVQGFQILQVASSAQFGAVDAEYTSGSGWVIQNNTIEYSHGMAISVFPSVSGLAGSTITNNTLCYNGQEGLGTNGDNHVVTYNTICYNNTAGFDPGWQAGGAKFAGPPDTTNLLVQHNNVYNNGGPGLWCDINCYNVTFDSNTVSHNIFNLGTYQPLGTGAGIMFEISDRAVISNNTLTANGPLPSNVGFFVGADIIVSASPNVQVYGNTLTAAVNGIGLLQQFRNDDCTTSSGKSSYPDGTAVCPNLWGAGNTHSVHDTSIHDNVTTETDNQDSDAEVAGLDSDMGVTGMWDPSAHNKWTHDTYTLPNLTYSYFSWENNWCNDSCWTGYGQDTTGVFK